MHGAPYGVLVSYFWRCIPTGPIPVELGELGNSMNICLFDNKLTVILNTNGGADTRCQV